MFFSNDNEVDVIWIVIDTKKYTSTNEELASSALILTNVKEMPVDPLQSAEIYPAVIHANVDPVTLEMDTTVNERVKKNASRTLVGQIQFVEL